MSDDQPTNADVGKIILVRDYECDPWFPRRLRRIDQSKFGPFYECDREDGKPGHYLWAYAKRPHNPETQFPVVQPNPKPQSITARQPIQLMNIDPETMRGRCYTCRFWIDSNKCEQVKGMENGFHVFNQDCRECWARHPLERKLTMAHELCAKWKPKLGLAYEPAAFESNE
jgi:hypothetical protein